MKQITIMEAEAGQRMDRLLARCLKEAPKGFLYRMLRKKNITLNERKADGSERLRAGDRIQLFLSDETCEKFGWRTENVSEKKIYPAAKLSILYEDAHVLLVNKPAGMLSQKAKPSDVSLNEYLLGYLLQSGQWEEGASFRPSVCNRLDRNTSGIVVCGKTLTGLKQMSEVLRDRALHKYYLCLVGGRMEFQDPERRLKAYLLKDPAANQVEILSHEKPGARPIVTVCRLRQAFEHSTLLEVCLITGRPHQIRAHLSFIGHPVIGDPKYGDLQINRQYREKYGLTGQFLHSWKLVFPALEPPLQGLSEKVFEAELPERLKIILKEESHGNLEF